CAHALFVFDLDVAAEDEKLTARSLALDLAAEVGEEFLVGMAEREFKAGFRRVPAMVALDGENQLMAVLVGEVGEADGHSLDFAGETDWHVWFAYVADHFADEDQPSGLRINVPSTQKLDVGPRRNPRRNIGEIVARARDKPEQILRVKLGD